jgi:predicted RNA-binding Zn-ribbon protein involved in translation (DUF1610 family)
MTIMAAKRSSRRSRSTAKYKCHDCGHVDREAEFRRIAGHHRCPECNSIEVGALHSALVAPPRRARSGRMKLGVSGRGPRHGDLTREEANAYLAAILETVAASPDGAPSGVMFAGLSGGRGLRGPFPLTAAEYRMLLGLAKAGGLVTERADVVRITDRGRDMVRRIEAHRAAR